MPEFKGQTDKLLKVQLKSALVSARWGLPAVALGGRIPIEVETRFVADGSDIKITIKDAQGAEVETLNGKVYGNRHRTIFALLKPNKTGGMYFEAEMSAHGLKGVGPKLRVLPPVLITDLKWADEKGSSVTEVADGQKVELSAKMKGPVDGTEAYIAVRCRKGEHQELCVASFPVKVKDGKLSLKWTVKLPGGPGDVAVHVELARLGLEYFQPVFLFEGGCFGVSADSPEVRLESWIEYDFKGRKGKATLILPDGAEETKDVPENGILRIEKPKVGRVRLKDFVPVDKDGKPLGPEVLPGEDAESEAGDSGTAGSEVAEP
ncbi:MAG: hypothetical protein ABIW76_21130 [Fibrobacteria bacterium]